MKDNNSEMKFYMTEIFCFKCQEIKKIKINSNWNDKTIYITFECEHDRNEKEDEQINFCINCKKFIEQNQNCNKKGHSITQNPEILFCCITHMKKFNGYCNKCEKIYATIAYVIMKILKTNTNIIFPIIKLKK